MKVEMTESTLRKLGWDQKRLRLCRVFVTWQDMYMDAALRRLKLPTWQLRYAQMDQRGYMLHLYINRLLY